MILVMMMTSEKKKEKRLNRPGFCDAVVAAAAARFSDRPADF